MPWSVLTYVLGLSSSALLALVKYYNIFIDMLIYSRSEPGIYIYIYALGSDETLGYILQSTDKKCDPLRIPSDSIQTSSHNTKITFLQ